MENTAIISDLGSNHYLPGHSKPYDPRAAADAQESMKAKLIANRKKVIEQVRNTHIPPFFCMHSLNPPVCDMFLKVFWRFKERIASPQGGARTLRNEGMFQHDRDACYYKFSIHASWLLC